MHFLPKCTLKENNDKSLFYNVYNTHHPCYFRTAGQKFECTPNFILDNLVC